MQDRLTERLHAIWKERDKFYITCIVFLWDNHSWFTFISEVIHILFLANTLYKQELRRNLVQDPY